MRMGFTPIRLAACAILLFSAGTAAAAVTTFFGEDLSPVAGPPPSNIPNTLNAHSNFMNALGQYWTHDAEVEYDLPDPINFVGPSGTLTAWLGGDASAGVYTPHSDYATSGINVIGGTEGWRIWNIDGAVNAIGMFGIGIPGVDPQKSQIRLEITFTNGDVETFTSPNTLGIDTPSMFYFGLVDDTRFIEEVRFRALASTQVQIAVDDITFGVLAQPVPEPASAALVLLGLSSAVAFRGRRQRVPRT